MIGYLRGEILDHSEGKVLLNTAPSQEGGAVGYLVNVPSSAEYGAFDRGKRAEFFIYTHVREDSLDLYGFSSPLEKDLFLTLLTVNGIGPKGALGILSKVNPDLLIQAILQGDKESLTQIPGVGKKTAERVVLELADPLRKKVESGLFKLSGNVPSTGTKAGANAAAGASADRKGFGVIQDAKAALVGLGYREQDVSSLLNRLLSEFDAPPTKAEELIRVALKRLG